ncbi:MAG: cupin domain-containing protein [Thaumarchaeota archaeon]|nr:cupin domain-containing protein [Nitrososphaerota archaeon]
MEIRKIKPAFEDERGAIFDILEEPVEHTGMIRSKKGSVRGNHYHKESTQYTFVLSGKMEFTTRDAHLSDGPRETAVLLPGDLVVTPPMEAHVMRFLEDTVFIDLTTKSRRANGYEGDTVRVQV